MDGLLTEKPGLQLKPDMYLKFLRVTWRGIHENLKTAGEKQLTKAQMVCTGGGTRPEGLVPRKVAFSQLPTGCV